MLSPTLNGGSDNAAGPSGSHRDAASSSSSAHPFSLKVRSILTRPPSKYDDEVVAKGLRALEERYALGQDTASSSKSKVKAKSKPQRRSLKLYSDSSDEADDGNNAAPSSTSSSSTIPLPRIKSHLERDAHTDLLHSTTTYLTHLTQITTHLNSISTSLTSMRQQCDQVDEDLSRSNDATRYLLEQASGLERQRTVTQQQALVARLFLSRFCLTEKEREIIQRRDYPVGPDLFAVMDRLHSMRQDCLALLEGGGESGGGTRAGTDVMAETGSLLDLAYEKVGRFLNFHFRQAPREGLDVGETLKEAVGRLVESEGPQGEEVLRPALGVLAGMRSGFLAGEFQQALQRGTGEGGGASSSSASSSLRPIEMHAHDPMRYVGDMLAWVHQAVAGEREFLGQLFGEKEGEGGRRVGERRRGIEGSIDWGRRGSRPPEPTVTRTVSAQAQASTSRRLAYVRDTLNRSLEGCCRPLTVRVQQTIDVQSSPLVALRLFHLIDFYTQVMLDTLGSRSSLSKALKDLNKTAWQAFAEAVQRQAEQLQREAVEVPTVVAGKRRGTAGDGGDELGPPSSLLSALATVKELIDAHGQSASSADSGSAQFEGDGDEQQGEKEGSAVAADGAEEGAASFNSVLTTLIDAMLDLIERTEKLVVEAHSSSSAAPANKGSQGGDNATARAHGLVFRLNCLERIVGTLDRGGSKDASSNSLVAPLRSSLTTTHDALVEATYSSLLTSSGLAPTLAPASPPQITLPALQAFSSLLSSPSGSLGLATPPEWLGRVSAPRQRAEVFAQAMRRLVEGYDAAVERCREEGGVQVGEGLKGLRSGEEARMLLGV